MSSVQLYVHVCTSVRTAGGWEPPKGAPPVCTAILRGTEDE